MKNKFASSGSSKQFLQKKKGGGIVSESLNIYSIRERFRNKSGMTVLLIVMLNLFHYSSFSQGEQSLDSLFTILNTTKDDTTKVNIMLSICTEKWWMANYADAKKYADGALILSERIGFTNGIADANNQIGIIYWYLLDYQNALYYNQKALTLYQESNNKVGISKTFNRIGHDYADLLNFDKALEYWQKALALDEQLNDTINISRNLDLIGFVYMNKADYPKALEYYFKALDLNETIKNKIGIASVCSDIGVVYEKQNNLSEALKYETRGLVLSLEIAEKRHITEAYTEIEKIYLKMHNFPEAYNARIKNDTIKDALINANNAGKIKQLQMQYDFDKKITITKAEQEKKDALTQKELQKQKWVRNSFICGFAVVMLFAGIFFKQRNKIKKGKKLSDDLLLNILPSEVAEELKQKGSADAKHFDEVTVMFTDFKGFTQISEKLSPADLVARIDYCFKAFDHIITKHNIEKIKTIGDAYMCAGGLPVANKTNANDVIKAAIEIQQFMQQHFEKNNIENNHDKSEPFEIRIGIHTGPVVAGIVGVKKFAYDIWGDTVNIASRMESSGEAGKVNISGSTYQLVKDKFNCIHRGKIEAKNKGEIDMYFVEQPN